jgi:hypothetical protein
MSNPRGHNFTVGYIPLSALTSAEQERYLKEVAEKSRRFPHAWRGNAARAGLRARIVRERKPTNPTTPGGTRRRS